MSTNSIHVIGAGIVGVCTALYLQRAGYSVTLIDPSGIGEETSAGNAGGIAITDVVPLSIPGVWKNLPKWLLDPLGPLAVRPSYMPQMAPWGLRFLANANMKKLDHITRGRAALCNEAHDAYAPLLSSAGITDIITGGEALTLYESEREFRDDAFKWEMRGRHGVKYQVVPGAELRQMESDLSSHFHCAVINEGWRHVADPKRMTQSLGQDFIASGGSLDKRGVKQIETDTGKASALILEDGSRLEIDRLVVAAGAWSHKLARQLGERVPLETERGYHMTLPNPGVSARRMFIYVAQGFVITPMEMGLRVAGTVEFAGLEAEPDYRRAEILIKKAQKVFPGLNGAEGEAWMGHRPSLPDSMPVISRSVTTENVTYAFGHDHLGLTMGAITGKLVSEIVSGQQPSLDISPYRINRF